MKKLIFPAMLFLLAGCAAQGTHSEDDVAKRHRAGLHAELGGGYFAQGRLALALQEFTEATKIDPGYAPAYSGLGLVHAALHQDDKAETNYKQALRLDPESSEVHNNYGTFLCSRDRIDESITEFMTAVRNPLYPTPQSAYLNAGICSLKKQDDKSAEAYLLRALQIQPSLNQASSRLAQLYFKQGKLLQARKYLELAMRNVEPSPDMLWLGVRIERVLGDRNAEASYSMLLRNQYPDSDQTKAMLSE